MTTRIKRDYGTWRALGALYAEAHDIKGNNNKIWCDEDQPAGQAPGKLTTNPFLLSLAQAARVCLTPNRAANFVEAVRGELETSLWGGAPSTQIDTVSDGRIARSRGLAAAKAFELSKLGLTPDDLVDRIIVAEGQVKGAPPIKPRRIRTEFLKPWGCPNGKVVHVDGAFTTTGRFYRAAAMALRSKGYGVHFYDAPGHGYSEGARGSVGNGYERARDAASAIAAGFETARQNGYPNGAEMLLYGHSFGATTALLVKTLLANDRLEMPNLDALEPIRRTNLVAESAFLAPTPNEENKRNIKLGRSFLGKWPLPIFEVNGLTVVEKRHAAQQFVLDDARQQVSALFSADEAIAWMLSAFAGESGLRPPEGDIYFIHGTADEQASLEAVQTAANALAKRASFVTEREIIEGVGHVINASENAPRPLVGIQAIERAAELL